MREFRSRELVREIEELLAHAKAGRVAGIAYCVQTARGSEHVGLIGKYKGDAARVLLASAHLHNRAQQIISGEGD